jgi:hypothetical protein
LEAPTGMFRQLVDKNKNYHRAADFWKNESAGIEHYLTKDGRYYIKRDPANGRTLFIDVEKEAFVGWHLDDDGVFKGDYEALAKTFCSVHGLPGGLRYIKVGNVVIDLASDKFNVILGRFDLSSIPGFETEIGTKQIIEQISLLKNYSFASKNYELAPGALHVLNIPEGMSELAQKKGMDFWEAFNKYFLDLVVENKERANVIFVVDVFKKDILKEYDWIKRDFNDRPSYLAKEIKYLRESQVRFALDKFGNQVDMMSIDLTDLAFEVK